MQLLAQRGARDPMEMVTDQGQMALLAEALLGEGEPPSVDTVRGAIASRRKRLIENELRDLRARIAEAERRADHAELAVLTQKKLDLDRTLRRLHS
jgi:DNA primase